MRKRPAEKGRSRTGAGQLRRTLRSLLLICGLGVALAVYNAVSLHRDVGLAVGPPGPAQEQFFRDASERPDIASFFENMPPDRRLVMAENIGRYTDPEMAKLCAKCLGAFDVRARAALTASLAIVSKVHPDATAALMNLPGSFQQLGIAAALRQAGPGALPLVAKEFTDGDARPNAVAYLVAAGPTAIAPTMPYLDNSDKDIRLAAADTLGKLRAREALPKLTALYAGTKEDEQMAYLTALAGIGDPSSEALMGRTLADETLSNPARAQAALGLGQIGTNSAISTLWEYAVSADKTVRDGAVAALQLAGDRGLTLTPLSHRPDPATNRRGVGTMGEGAGGERPASAVLAVAGGIHTPTADTIIRAALLNSTQSTQAAAVAANRPSLVASLVEAAHRYNAATQGDSVDAILLALATTTEGRAALKTISSQTSNPPLAALADRRLRISRG